MALAFRVQTWICTPDHCLVDRFACLWAYAHSSTHNSRRETKFYHSIVYTPRKPQRYLQALSQAHHLLPTSRLYTITVAFTIPPVLATPFRANNASKF